ncbi:MAG: fibronectin type III domain-containing protein [Armatimonadetes bacterium]|nr:fibronectin type III domain-containing protein [Armatimonadota bacterium]
MRTPILRYLTTALATVLISACATATEIKIDDSINSQWISTSGSWTTGTSSAQKYGSSYYYANQEPDGAKAVTFTPVIPFDDGSWEVYVWYSSGMDRATQAECVIHHASEESRVLINQQQNGGMWVYLGTYQMDGGSSDFIRITNNGLETGKVVVADAVRLYSSLGDKVPPIISNVGSTPGSNSAVIKWQTDEPATSQVHYGLTSSYGSSSQFDSALVKDHEMSITGLSPETTYHFRVKSEDGAGNIGLSGDYTFTTGPPDNFPPIISGITVVPGANSAVVLWTTDEPATSQVEYGETGDYGHSTVLKTALVTEHRVIVLNLTPDTVYHLRVKSSDGAGNAAVSDDVTFTSTSPDTEGPVISDMTASADVTSAVVTWVTNEYSTSRVEYGLTPLYGVVTALDADLVVEHSVSLANLQPQTTYYYRVISVDGSGNQTISPGSSFETKPPDTIPPEFSNVQAVPASRTCLITWTTNEASTSQVTYGLADPPDVSSAKQTERVTSHSVTLSELEPETKYYFTVLSCDALDNCGASQVFWFTTKASDVTPPVISEILAEPGSVSVVITWATNEPATSQVEYGETDAYGNLTAIDPNWVTDHRVVITTLASGTEYHFRVRSMDSDGNEAVSEDHSFTTQGPDETAPVISEVSVSQNMNSAIIRWRTDEPATSRVDYGTTTAYGEYRESGDLVKIHSVTLTDLLADTLYHFRITCSDDAGNTAISGDYTFRTSLMEPEYRMIWADTWHNGFLSEAETAQFIDAVSDANYNAVVVEVRKAGDAYYLSGYEPWATNISPPGGIYDPLQDLINKAHAKGIEVHAWIVTFRAWYNGWPTPPDGHIWREHGAGTAEDWAMRNSSGGYLEGNSLNVDPGVPAVQDYMANIVKDIVSKYPQVDGINFDYIRYPGALWGYNQYTKDRFFAEYGYYPPTSSADPNWGAWCDYRRRQVTDLVRRCYVEAMHINPRIKMSVDTVGWEGPDPSTNYEGTSQYAGVFQDARAWMQQHIVDINVLMNYKREFNTVQKASYRVWADWLPRVANSTGRLAVDGQGVYLNSIAGSVTQMNYSREAGSDGLCSYSYAVTNKDGQPAGDFFTAVKSNLFGAPAPIPDMPWKDQPTTGILFGTATDSANPNDPIYRNWLYKAEVNLTGPVNRSTLTDATGTYAFLDLPAGTYAVEFAKPGYKVKSYGGLTVAAGDVLRRDASLESGMFTSPPGAVATGWNLISLPLVPANPDPGAVFSGLDIEGRLYRWDKVNKSIIAFTEWSPEEFGEISTDEGYWLQSTRNAAISYEPAEVQPEGPRTIVLPKAGWNIIGCPFTTPRDWNDMIVSYGSIERPASTARDYGWIDTICYWWDNSVPGGAMLQLGLDDDWVDTTFLQPWRGYWFFTKRDDIRIRIY